MAEQASPAASLFLQVANASAAQAAVRDQWKAVTSDFQKTHIPPSDKTINDIADAANAGNDHALNEQIGADLSVMRYESNYAGMSLPEQNAARAELASRGASGEFGAGYGAIDKDLREITNSIRSGLEKDPISTTATYSRGRIAAPAPLDFSSPQSLVAGIQSRARISQIGSDQWKTGPLPILDRSDVKQLTGALNGQDAPTVLGALSQGLSSNEMQGLLREEDFRKAVTGISRSGDPAKMNAAYSFIDTLQKQNPLQFEKQFPDGLNDLRAWQSNLSFYPPDEAAKRLMQAYDPNQSKALEAVDKAADKALSSMSADKVVSKFSTGFIFGTNAQTPAAAQAGLAAGALKADYDKNFKDGYAATGDGNAADNFAMEKLNLKYALSPTNGNRVMPYAPERYYPEIGGSHDWMTKQLDDAVAQHFGVNTKPDLTAALAGTVEQTASLMDERSPAERQYGARRALVSDEMTERDIASGRPPSYQVIVQDPNGRWGAISGAAGAARFRFDPAQPFAERAAAAERVRPTISNLQTPLAGGVTP